MPDMDGQPELPGADAAADSPGNGRANGMAPGRADAADLLTIGLLVFFIALLLTVGALLVLPMILG